MNRKTILNFMSRYYERTGRPPGTSAIYPYMKTYLQARSLKVLDELTGWPEVAMLKNNLGHYFFLPVDFWNRLSIEKQKELINVITRKYPEKKPRPKPKPEKKERPEEMPEKTQEVKPRQEKKPENAAPSWLLGEGESYGF